MDDDFVEATKKQFKSNQLASYPRSSAKPSSSLYYQSRSAQSSTSSIEMTSRASAKRLDKKDTFLNSTAQDWFGTEDEKAAKIALKQKQSLSASEGSTASLNGGVTSSPQATTAQASVTKESAAQHPIQGRVLPNKQSDSSLQEPVPTSKPVIYQKKNLQASPVDAKHKEEAVKESADDKTASEIVQLNTKIARYDKFKALLQHQNVDLEKLRKLSWSGIPDEFRAVSWQLLMGYMPLNSERRPQALQKKRAEYQDYVQQTFGRGKDKLDHTIWHQIHIDVPRTNPLIKMYQNERIQESLERILYCWAIRHPASGYVQGINDLCTPFFQCFLGYLLRTEDVEAYSPDEIPESVLSDAEADTFWCLSRLLDGIQDNYTHAQPGILRQLQKMKELIGRINAQLCSHLQEQGVDFVQFAFRWMNCLLMREMSIKNVTRMWDTYLSEGPDGFSDFHVYVCAAFLAKWSDHLQKLEFQDIIMFLQSPPTKEWSEKDIELLLSEAYMWKSLFHNSPSHLSGNAHKSANPWSI